MRLEVVLLGLFLAAWCLGLLSVAVGLPLAGLLPLSLYQLYGIAAAAGWLSGNLYVQRARRLPRKIRSRVLLIYLLGPPSLIYLLRTMAPAAQQAAVPLAGIWAFAVLAIFFMVPVSLRRPDRTSDRYRDGR
jgi:hypothetical protein